MFSSTFVAHCVFSDFSIGFCLIFDPKMTKKLNVFLIVVCFFLNQATFTKHCILQVRSYVFSFWVFVIFVKNRWKNDCKIGYTKIIEKWAQGGPKIATKWLRINEKKSEKLKNHQTNKFLVIPFFQWFFESRKNKKKTPKSWTWPSGETESANFNYLIYIGKPKFAEISKRTSRENC